MPRTKSSKFDLRIASRTHFRPTLERLEDRINPVSFGYALGLGSGFDDQGLAIASDAAGNTFVTGLYQLTVDFDPGPGTTNLNSVGRGDIFVAKYDPAGALVWAKSMGGPDPTINDQGNAIALDGSGNIYVAGTFSGTADFDPGPGTLNLNSPGPDSAFVAKLDGGGNLLWARGMGGASSDTNGRGIAVDVSGNVFTVGDFTRTVDFDPGTGTSNLTATGGSGSDVFVSKLDNAGNFIWAKQLGGSSSDLGFAVAVDGSGNAYATGTITGNIFITKLDSAGNLAWSNAIGSTGADNGRAIAVDAAGNVYYTGSFQGTVDFDPGAGTSNLTSLGADNIFVSKLNTSGNLVWVQRLGGAGPDFGFGITLDAAGNIYSTGYFFDTSADFDPGPGTFNLTGAGMADIYVSKLDNAGNFIWAAAMTGPAANVGFGIAVDGTGNVFTTGGIVADADFDPGPGTYTLTSAGVYDIFVSKLVQYGVAVTPSAGSTDITEAGPTDTFTVALTLLPTADVLVTLNPGSQLTPSAATLTFTTLNWSSAQIVTVTAFDDPTVEGNHTGVISFTTSSSDTNYSGLVSSLTANITDNDAAGGGFPIGLGSTGADVGNAITTDAAGNVYVTGAFQATVDFDPGPGTTNLTPVGSDIFVAKYDAAGALMWARSMGGTSADVGFGIAVDAAGNVYTTGNFKATADFDPGTGTFNLTPVSASDDIFVSKLDSAGNFVWARSLGGTGADFGQDIALDAAGNVYTSGIFQATADFDPGTGTANLTSAGQSDVFVSKLDSAGNFVWVRGWGGTDFDSCGGLAVDAAGNVYTTGQFGGTVDFDPGTGTVNLSTSSNAIYVSKLNSAGNLVWAKAMGGTTAAAGSGIAVDGSGNVYTTGFFSTTADFDPGPGSATFTSAGLDDTYFSKLDAAGNFVWAKAIGSTGWDDPSDIAIDAAGNIYTLSLFAGTLDVDPGTGTFNLTSAGSYDPFILKLDPAGNFTWAVRMGGSGMDSGKGIALDAAGNVYTTGSFSATADFDPGPGTLNLTSAGGDDIFIAQITQHGVSIIQSAGSTNVTEGGATDTYTVVLNSLPTDTVFVTLASGAQLTLSATTLTFTTLNWSVAQIVTVTAVDDPTVEGPHTGVITHTTSSTDTNYSGLTSTLTAGITDNDSATPAGVTVVPSGGFTDVGESGLTDSYTVVLNSMPTADVFITLNPGTQLTVLPSSRLTFTTLNWNQPQTVTVGAVDDLVAQGTRTAVITQAATSADALYHGRTVASVTVSIADDDLAGIVFSPITVNVAEDGPGASYTVRLASQPTANVIVSVTPVSQVGVSSATLIFTPNDWDTPQIVNVTAIDDLLAEGDHSGLITHAAVSTDAAYAGPAATVTAFIADNDRPSVLFSQLTGPILEGTSKSYSVVLNAAPGDIVVLTISGDGQATAPVAEITFTPDDWNVPRPVLVTAIDDGDEEGDHIGVLSQTTVSDDPTFDGLQIADVTVSIVDNDGSFVAGTEGNDQIVINFVGGRATVLVNGVLASLPAAPTQILLFAGGGNDSIQINNPTIPVVVQGGGGTDKVFVTGRTSSNRFVLSDSSVSVNGVSVGVWNVEGLTVGGKAGNDTFTIDGVPTFPVELKGEAGIDLVIGAPRNNTWQITASNTGTLDGTIKIANVENWTGGTANDNFAFAPGRSLTGRVDGGGGDLDSLDYSAYTSAVTVNLNVSTAPGVKGFHAITRFVGGKSAADKLIGANQNNNWSITGQNAGNVDGVFFQGLENLTGGTRDDTFHFADGQSVKGKIDGGGGTDRLDFAGYISRGVIINLQTKTATNLAGFISIEAFAGGSGGGDTLIGLNRINLWNLTEQGGGTVSGTRFGNFENLTGGSLADNFTLAPGAAWDGTLNGGTGQDVLSAAPGQNIWTTLGTGTGTLNGKRFLGVEIRR